METVTVLANYLRVLGFSARAHSATTSDVELSRLVVKVGSAQMEVDHIIHLWLGGRFGFAAVTTDMPSAYDQPLAAVHPKLALKSLDWILGWHGGASRSNRNPYVACDYVSGAQPFETLKRVDNPTTYMDELNITRVPKRTDMFAWAQFGDRGPQV